ncbi:MAG: Major facilitator superfamily [Parcubacteria group bacterium GW2011_GWA2_49_9]|nr:MAG: Major facilitator superfamily [Parcubacteria group bacterium GW2011_GWA2_49_9]
MIKKLFGVERNVFFMGLVSFFNDFSNEMIVSVFPAFFSSVLKSGAASLGFIEGVADGISNLTKVFSGRLSDKTQKRKMLALSGYILSVATRPFYLISSVASHILGIRVIDRIGKGIREAPRDALLSLSANPEHIGRSFGFHRAMDSLGSILGPLTAFLILERFPGAFNTVFITAFFVGILALFSFVFIKEVQAVHARGEKIRLRLTSHTKEFKRFLGIIFLLSLANLPIALLLLRTQDLGLRVSFIPLFYLFYSVAYTLLSTKAGHLADKVGDKPVILGGYLLMGLAYLLLIYDQTLVALAVGFIVLGVGSATTDSVQRSFAARLTSPEERGNAYGLLNAAIGFGLLISGIVGGLLWQNFGATTALTFGLALILIALIAFGLIGGKRARIQP